MGRGLLLSLQYPDICISAVNCLEHEADWSRPAGAEGPGVRRPAVRHSYSIMGPPVNLGLLLEARCRNEHFYVIPNRVTGFDNFNEKTLLVLSQNLFILKSVLQV